MMNVTAGELGREFGLEVLGDGGCRLTQAASLDEAGEGSLTFVRSAKYAKGLETTKASAVIVPKEIEVPRNGKTYLVAENPYVSFAAVIGRYLIPRRRTRGGVHPMACVAPSVRIGSDVTVEPFVMIDEDAVIGDRCVIMSGTRIGRGVILGADCLLHANVVLEEGSRLGARVILNPGVVIGSEGFGFDQTANGNVKLPHIGTVEVGDDVEIGANTTVDRSSLGKTIIGSGTKIDNLVQIGHGVQLGRHNVLCAQTGIAGSVRTGDRVIFASRAGVRDHVSIGSNVTVGPTAGVTKDLPDGVTVSGFPAIPHHEWLKINGVLAQLPALREQLKDLQRRE